MASSVLKQTHRDISGLIADGEALVHKETANVQAQLDTNGQKLGQTYNDYSHYFQGLDINLAGVSEATLQAAMRDVMAGKDKIEQRASQVGALDKTTMMGMQDGLKRWSDAEAEQELRASVMQRAIMEENAQPKAAEELKGKGRLSEDRVNAGMSVLGDETESIAEDAGNQVALSGSQMESQAKANGMGIEMQMQGINAQEQRAYQQQATRDQALASGVGNLLDQINGVEVDASRKAGNAKQAALSVEELLGNERESLQKNVEFLEKYNQQSGEKVTKMLGEVTMTLEKRLQKAAQGLADIAGSQHVNEARLDELQGSKAYQTLSKIQGADDYASEALLEGDFFREWMLEHNDKTEEFRTLVEKSFAEHEEAAALHSAEMDAQAAEGTERMKSMDQSASRNLENMVGALNGASTAEIEKGFEDSMGTFKKRQEAAGELDEERIKNLLNVQQGLTSKMNQAIADGDRALAETAQTSGGSYDQMHQMEGLLSKMGQVHDEEVNAKMKNLQDRQRQFDQNLLFATVNSGAGDAANVPEMKESDLQNLVKEAQSLSQEHESLEQKRIATGRQIGDLFTKLVGALNTVQAPEAGALIQAGQEQQLRHS